MVKTSGPFIKFRRLIIGSSCFAKLYKVLSNIKFFCPQWIANDLAAFFGQFEPGPGWVPNLAKDTELSPAWTAPLAGRDPHDGRAHALDFAARMRIERTRKREP